MVIVLSDGMKILIKDIKFKIIDLTDLIVRYSNTTITKNNLENEINIISSILDLFCSGSEGYDDTDNTINNDGNGGFINSISKSEILSKSSDTFNLLSHYFRESESQILFTIVENLEMNLKMIY